MIQDRKDATPPPIRCGVLRDAFEAMLLRTRLRRDLALAPSASPGTIPGAMQACRTCPSRLLCSKTTALLTPRV
jgi:hypothetical protein